jgi:peptidoglycan hydrolase-like protein with peptidoglycan-binding domain
MADTYPYGYPNGDPANGAGVSLKDFGPGSMKTVGQLNDIWTWRTLNPEVRRRAIALFDYCAAHGYPEGIGTGARSEAAQAALYKARDGKGVAPAGQSYHEDGVVRIGAVAIDCVPSNSHVFMNSVSHLFGFQNFRNVGGEPWHIQPIELPTARRNYNQNPGAYPLKTWVMPLNIPNPPPQPPVQNAAGLEYWKVEGAKMTTPTGNPALVLNSLYGDLVRNLQAVMVAEGFYTAAVDGQFGPLTEASVKRVQTTVGVGADGKYGPISGTAFTKWRLAKHPPVVVPPSSILPTPVGDAAMKPGATDATTIIPGVANEGRVTWYQTVIGVAPTGVYDTATVNITKFNQHNFGITEDGNYGPQTEAKLKAYRGR